jgi:hypothetical protein
MFDTLNSIDFKESIIEFRLSELSDQECSTVMGGRIMLGEPPEPEHLHPWDRDSYSTGAIAL